ncbi:polysaccharide pyruvyl transferase CsaB [Capsulimonas corticalis]|uniref:Polysaccharide pyruvyl transferase CsaB n=1 Tax=Capsulimonas corticalis TaxID=2219043 RepID=A0A402D3A0_9BACT|nr:polysaccharide pyruvyl transferase CsaB [Capsulimonas corticalis]BDI28331.1 polysaccharide pyruvyl transferase CsaB [Capsulimonas corticalis]
MSARGPRVALSGYYGFANAGDEAVLAGLIQSLRAGGGADLTIDALSIAPEETAATHSVTASHRYQVKALIESLRRADLLLSGGGSLLQDVTSAHGVFYYLGVVRLAQILGKKTMFIAQGIGPLIRPRTRRMVASVANRLDAVTVRDPESLALLREIGVSRPPMEVTADPALLLTSRAPSTGTREGQIAVSLRPWAQSAESLPEMVAKASAIGAPNARAIAVAMQPQSDFAPMEQFARQWRQTSDQQTVSLPASADAPLPLPDLLSAIGSSQMVVGMRLHALILAAAAGVPSAALAYDPKVGAFMRSTGQEDAVLDVHAADQAALDQTIARVWAERAERAGRLHEALPPLRASAMRNAEIALDLIRRR